MTKLLMDYSTTNNLILKINEKDEDKMNSLLYITSKNLNIKLLHYLNDYAKKK